MNSFLIKQMARFFEYIHKMVSGGITNPGVAYGLTIIAVTFIIKLILLPLNIKSTKSMIKSSEIQPEVNKLQAKYKNDPARMQKEVMKLYKEKGANPMSGCWPILIQLPIIMALYGMFNSITGIQGKEFLWIKDLASPDKTYILPILSGLTQFLMVKSTPTPGATSDAQKAQSRMMNITMPIVMVFITLKLKAALGVYWVASNIIQILQNFLVLKLVQMEKNKQD